VTVEEPTPEPISVAEEPPIDDLMIDDPGAGSDDEVIAPAVVVVMVTHDPGWWFEETLESIAQQHYPEVSVLVIDAGSANPEEVRTRVASVLPNAHLRRLETNPGFGPAANESLTAVQGSAFHLLCHDDVRLEPGVIGTLVEESFRSNAGVVGPKIVDWTDPSRLLSVGMSVDHYGQPSPFVERGDLDQEQFDSVRDVFYVQGAVTLVRSDLFDVLGGFDPEITFHGEDLDLGWRAHVAGARVLIAPDARVAHLESLGDRRPFDDRRRLQTRHRIRTRRAATTFSTRLRTTPFALFYAFCEILQAVVFGRFRHARDISSAWTWNFTHTRSTRALRETVAAIRRVDDGEVRSFQRRGNVRLSAFLRAQFGRSEGDESSWDFVSNLRATKGTLTVTAWLLIAVYLLIGSRELIFGSLPAVGAMTPMLGVGDMFSRWVSGYQTIGLGSTAPAPTGFGLFALLGAGLLGSVGLLRQILILGMLPLGVLAMWRLTRPVSSRRARVIATVAYLMVPIAAQSMSRGDWAGLVAFAAMPIVLSQLLGASELTPFGTRGGAAGPLVTRRPLTHRIVAIGLVTALAVTIAPAFVGVVIASSILLVIGGILAGQIRSAGRVLLAGFGGAVVAFVLHLPWSLSFVSDWRTILGSASSGASITVASITRFSVGPVRGGVLCWALLATALLPLLIGREWRLALAVRCWALVVGGLVGAWALGQGWISGQLPPLSLALIPAAVGVSLAIGLGVAAFEVDLPDYHFGWRQIASLLAAGAFVLAALPALGAALSGRWGMPRGDFTTSLSFLDAPSDQGEFRVLWLGDASALPLSGWNLEAPGIDALGSGRSLTFATSTGGTPSVAEQWAGPVDAGLRSLASSLEVAGAGGTARLGALVAPMAVRYIIVPLAQAPDPYASSSKYLPDGLLAMLDGQLDLDSVTVNPGLRVYRNAAWGPMRALLPEGTTIPAGGTALSERFLPQITGASPTLDDPSGFASWSGSLEPAGVTVYVAQTGGSQWTLSQNGAHLDRSDALGWASTFSAAESGPMSLRFNTAITRWLMLLGQVIVWGLAIFYLLRVRVRVDESAILVPKGEGDSGTESPGAGHASDQSGDGSGVVATKPTTATHDEIIAALIEGQT
jgi:GT2 family glycosyltransferase